MPPHLASPPPSPSPFLLLDQPVKEDWTSRNPPASRTLHLLVTTYGVIQDVGKHSSPLDHHLYLGHSIFRHVPPAQISLLCASLLDAQRHGYGQCLLTWLPDSTDPPGPPLHCTILPRSNGYLACRLEPSPPLPPPVSDPLPPQLPPSPPSSLFHRIQHQIHGASTPSFSHPRIPLHWSLTLLDSAIALSSSIAYELYHSLL
ncbi:MAG: hypothetical protein DHS80DRAFT_21446 [Piptocephalis tieghemiana]|nr:MAG: hypothetical protein DHS80DRAFT_21446 [Piptocephalis tieghemiana]